MMVTSGRPNAAWLPGPPLKPLLGLGVAVLALHLILLQAAPGAISVGETAPIRQFITRTIEINRPAPSPASNAAQAAPHIAEMPPPATPARNAAPAVGSGLASSRIADAPQSAPAAVDVQAAAMPASPPATVTPTAAEAPAPIPASPPAPSPAPTPARIDGPRATAFSIPGSVKLLYNVTGEVKKQAWNARGELLWRHDGQQYEARSEVSAFLAGSRVQTSAGRITAEGLAPTRFSDKSKATLATHFERDKGRISFSANTPEAPLLAGAQDRLSVFLQLGAMIAGDPARYPPASTISVQTAGPRDADTWIFTVEGEEKLALVNGEMAALKLSRTPRRDFDIKVELWLAPALGYLPVRMRLTQQNGDFVDQQLRATDRP